MADPARFSSQSMRVVEIESPEVRSHRKVGTSETSNEPKLQGNVTYTRSDAYPWTSRPSEDDGALGKDVPPVPIAHLSQPPGGGQGHPPVITTRLHHRGTLHRSRSGLLRSLEIPSRGHKVTSSYRLPRLLSESGVDEEKWEDFYKELRRHGSLDLWEWLGCSLRGFGDALVFFPGFPIVLPVATYRKSKFKSFEKFRGAIVSGKVEETLKKWNEEYFEQLALHVAVTLPGSGVAGDADVSSTKMFKYREKYGSRATLAAGTSNSWIPDPKEKKYRFKEGKYRWKAAQKGRIVVLPLELVPLKNRATPTSVGRSDYDLPPSPSEADVGEINFDLERFKKVQLERALIRTGFVHLFS